MRRTVISVSCGIAAGLLLAALPAAPARAQNTDTPARIIGPRPVAPAPLTPAPAPADPAEAADPPSAYAPASAATGPYQFPPRNERSEPPQDNAAEPPPSDGRIGSITVRPVETGPLPTPDDLRALSESVKIANPAELSVEILPGAQIALGTRISFRVSSKKPGYLILVDVDAAGKLTQIFPNPLSLLRGASKTVNFVRAGRPLQIPNPADALAGFEFIASPPSGTAMVLAILSDRPVQLIDLPDLPPALTGQAAAAAYLTKAASELRIPDDNTGRLLETRWSFAAKFYAIR
jgi:hypothetical protein